MHNCWVPSFIFWCIALDIFSHLSCLYCTKLQFINVYYLFFAKHLPRYRSIKAMKVKICHFYCIKCIFVLKGNSILFCIVDVSACLYIEKNNVYLFFSNSFFTCEKYLFGNILLFMILLLVMLNFENLIFDITYSYATSLGQIIMILSQSVFALTPYCSKCQFYNPWFDLIGAQIHNQLH